MPDRSVTASEIKTDSETGSGSELSIVSEIKRCTICAEHLPSGPRPVLIADARARILIIGQAPGRRVHASGIPWDDPSGKRLREWMALTREEFYNPSLVAIVPMGFCYPGTGSGGDLPPRPECAPEWHETVLDGLPDIRLTVLMSVYALRYYLKDHRKRTVTQTVKSWKEYAPAFIPLPHPSPRNNRWLKNNPWFETEVIPELRKRIRQAFDE